MSVAAAFSENKKLIQEVTPTVLPPDMNYNSPFNAAAGVKPDVSAPKPANDIVASVENTSASLQGMSGIQVENSNLGYGLSKGMEAAGEAFSAIFGAFTDKSENGPKQEEPTLAANRLAPPSGPMMSMPSAG